LTATVFVAVLFPKLFTAVNANVPPVMLTGPLNDVFAPDKVVVPEPTCANVPAPETTFDTVTASLRLNARVPALATVPPNGRFPVVPPPPTCNVPALIVVAPEYVLLPPNVNVPVPTFVNANVAPTLLVKPPPNAESVASPTVNVTVPLVALVVTTPPCEAESPLNEANVTAAPNPFKSNVPPLSTVTALFVGKDAPVNFTNPPPTTSGPVNVFEVPVNHSVPFPVFVIPPPAPPKT
jgi:hypothetical protein